VSLVVLVELVPVLGVVVDGLEELLLEDRDELELVVVRLLELELVVVVVVVVLVLLLFG
jgi:hypothetical protein